MPQGAGEALRRQQEEFYAMLEQRYAANATTLPDADPLSAIEEGSIEQPVVWKFCCERVMHPGIPT